MNIANIFYTIAQIIHNFGAYAVVGGTIFGHWPTIQLLKDRQKLAWIVLIGWILQGSSGAAFGAISYIFHGKFPDIQSIGKAALILKLACTVIGFILTAFYLRFVNVWHPRKSKIVWRWTTFFATTALVAAAILRWFS